MLRPTSPKTLVWLLLVLLQAPWQAQAAVANMDISTVPLNASGTAKPNIIFGLDDSGSMDFEVLLQTNDGAAWWQKPSSGTSSFTDASGDLWFNANGNAGVDGANTWYKYAYLFPDGNASDARNNTDATYDHFAIAPIPAFAYFRSYQYNPLYYNPYTTYLPWDPAYLSGATRTFSAASTSAARSHPWLPTSGSPTTINLAASLSSAATNWTFRMLPGMTIPGASISGIVGRRNGGTWNNVTTNVAIAAGDYWDVQIPYYPATYYHDRRHLHERGRYQRRLRDRAGRPEAPALRDQERRDVPVGPDLRERAAELRQLVHLLPQAQADAGRRDGLCAVAGARRARRHRQVQCHCGRDDVRLQRHQPTA